MRTIAYILAGLYFAFVLGKLGIWWGDPLWWAVMVPIWGILGALDCYTTE